MKSFLTSIRKELMSDFDIPRLTIPQLCYHARFEKVKKSRSTSRFARVIHNFVDHENPTSCNCLLHTLFYIVSTWNDKVVILEQEDTFISGFVCLINAILHRTERLKFSLSTTSPIRLRNSTTKTAICQ